MTVLYILIFYHLSPYGKVLSHPTFLATTSSVKACAAKHGHGDVEVKRLGILDDGHDTPVLQTTILVCPGDK